MKRWLGRGLLTVVVLLAAVAYLGPAIQFLFEVPIHVALGWAYYAYDVLPRVRPNPSAMFTAGVLTLSVALGAHWLFSSLYQERGQVERPWPVRWSALALGLPALLFISGIAVAGIVHQVGWLVHADRPLTRTGWGRGPGQYCLRAQRVLDGAEPGASLPKLRARLVNAISDADLVLSSSDRSEILIIPRVGGSATLCHGLTREWIPAERIDAEIGRLVGTASTGR